MIKINFKKSKVSLHLIMTLVAHQLLNMNYDSAKELYVKDLVVMGDITDLTKREKSS